MNRSGTRRKRRSKRRKSKPKNKSIAFGRLVRGARESIKQSKSNAASLNDTIIAAIRNVQGIKQRKKVKLPRVLKLPKFGSGGLAILPILSGLSAIGSITTSAAGVVKAIRDIENAKKQQQKFGVQSEEKKIGRGLQLIYKTGSGFYLKPFNSQQQQKQL